MGDNRRQRAQDVEIVGEPAYRVVVDRHLVTIADWPDDERAQRAWCLDRAIGAKPIMLVGAEGDGPARYIAIAEQFRAWINGAEAAK